MSKKNYSKIRKNCKNEDCKPISELKANYHVMRLLFCGLSIIGIYRDIESKQNTKINSFDVTVSNVLVFGI